MLLRNYIDLAIDHICWRARALDQVHLSHTTPSLANDASHGLPRGRRRAYHNNRMMVLLPFEVCTTVLVAVVALTTAQRAAAATDVPASLKTRPNLVFFFPDTLRAESFNCYGNEVQGLTPNFDRFAETGTLFEQAHVMNSDPHIIQIIQE